ncbi:MarR family winged helix-turn-helix transcriptional regulator [Novosphingobium bradum]|uniref:MarR family winged helix-turn-helix transcriptional regulator n=1 Tax=Novosphingobium bradum TaxID=1737444 RepID=A0ABV7IPF9_9SPHN
MLHLDGEDITPINALIVSIFRVGGSLLEAGARLVADIGITPAWWQVLGALSLSPVPLTVPQIARHIGLARQSVQRIVDLLETRGLVRLEPNPHHRRARLVMLSEAGIEVYRQANVRQAPWAEQLEAGLTRDRVAEAVDVLARLELLLADQKIAVSAKAPGRRTGKSREPAESA